MVKLRLKRYGRKKRPFYRVIAIDSRCRRDGKALKELGFYDPIAGKTQLDVPNIIFYLKAGAQTSETVGNLLQKAKVFNQLSLLN
uniref:Small ribosomal subunit protein bS16c n=1 Tax=Mesostigma viride TaxID=41882 RepID=RR16_MESVI|nr:ribosomal protein S16 [Mesostigma viride]Q9MUR5.1 RecName: Full=Small ribosomal subunit protein bS16c; AltName: Full=30S ribosomal protein S16, chloroplastic [Mesostigma viride]AAF43836.1 ribosomal protein S16 [Mesostigma viride]WKT08270.1 ribosomal protein S16 [Mesostigma viride]